MDLRLFLIKINERLRIRVAQIKLSTLYTNRIIQKRKVNIFNINFC